MIVPDAKCWALLDAIRKAHPMESLAPREKGGPDLGAPSGTNNAQTNTRRELASEIKKP